VSQVPPSITLAIVAKAKTLKEKGIEILSFSVGKPDSVTPDQIKGNLILMICENAGLDAVILSKKLVI
jgi:aspartate aminotransferase